ncbi:integration host factor subunit alpha [Enterobacteriaceae endosymbiont of Plateumaris sericea]|uniref:integration host factor subunit alpha n=1 Tax=Enterobacteriaceae endosymbiont of Plateumaris sericea TaxID=2675797 RepID=UPI001449CDD0|nr:integration host factor subunit alpha [Enterobacteriaceae endosymbiont of Plateumaris sericea]QJC29859.1 integration host factor subunit alpha [Enterobacteriaceae endosymbiont of Plateumaris sericea]
MTLTKKKISKYLVKTFKIHKIDAIYLVSLFFDELKKTLLKGEMVKLSGFGKFEIRNKNSRPGRNPKTGEFILINARKVIIFRAYKKIKESIYNIKLNI